MKKANILIAGMFLLNTAYAGNKPNYGEVKPVENKQWSEECSACHIAYQPGLMTKASWNKLLDETALSDHFGQDASLDSSTLKEIQKYANEEAADSENAKQYKRSQKIVLSTQKNSDATSRITLTKYIQRVHHELSPKKIAQNQKVKSLSQCDACHTEAKNGVYDEDTVEIPNFGKYRD